MSPLKLSKKNANLQICKSCMHWFSWYRKVSSINYHLTVTRSVIFPHVVLLAEQLMSPNSVMIFSFGYDPQNLEAFCPDIG